HYNGEPIRVTPGPHHLMITSSPCCGAKDYDLGPNEVETPKLKLPWRNGRLIVKTHPEDANISYVTEADATTQHAKGGETLHIASGREAADAKVKVGVGVRARGHDSRPEACTAYAGQPRECSIELKRRGE